MIQPLKLKSIPWQKGRKAEGTSCALNFPLSLCIFFCSCLPFLKLSIWSRWRLTSWLSNYNEPPPLLFSPHLCLHVRCHRGSFHQLLCLAGCFPALPTSPACSSLHFSMCICLLFISITKKLPLSSPVSLVLSDSSLLVHFWLIKAVQQLASSFKCVVMCFYAAWISAGWKNLQRSLRKNCPINA